jgi:hypothetical protein
MLCSGLPHGSGSSSGKARLPFSESISLTGINVEPFVADLSPPALAGVSVITPQALDVLFTEPVDAASSQSLLNYKVTPAVGFPSLASRDASNASLVHLSFPVSIPPFSDQTLAVTGVADGWGNVLVSGVMPFRYDPPRRYDVVINEIMADPSPPNGLPEAEFIELKNGSGHSILLGGWRLSTTTSAGGVVPVYALPPDSFLVLTSPAQASRFPPGTRVLGVPGFPALDNDGATIILTSAEGVTIHAVAYSADWYRSDLKRDGGWTLEMIDAGRPCSGDENWKASADPRGGTPGSKNSIAAIVADDEPPRLLRTVTDGSLTVVAYFNEPLDSSEASVTAHYTIDAHSVALAAPQPPLFQAVSLRLSQPLAPGTVYSVRVNGLRDCAGNEVQALQSVNTGLPSRPAPGDLVINEILFDPRPGAYDYLELYNAGTRIIDVSRLYLSNGTAGTAPRRVHETPYFLFPGNYVVFTEDIRSLSREYFMKDPQAVMSLSLPSFPDDHGRAVLLDDSGGLIDELPYDSHWHFGLLSDKEGVSLERLHPAGPTSSASTWHSAASTAGWGTPGYRNSQSQGVNSLAATVTISPPVFSPDNDGRADVLLIYLLTPGAGSMGSVTIFDAAGRLVRSLVRNATLANESSFTWDGLGQNGRVLSPGTYIVFTEVFDLKGHRRSFKNTVVLVRPL